jgi:hypothetical protein
MQVSIVDYDQNTGFIQILDDEDSLTDVQLVKETSGICEMKTKASETPSPKDKTSGRRYGASRRQRNKPRQDQPALVSIFKASTPKSKGKRARAQGAGKVDFIQIEDSQDLPAIPSSEEVQTPTPTKKSKRPRTVSAATSPPPPPPPSIPDELLCPITLCVMADPVVAMDGHTYERAAIADWLRRSLDSPQTGAALSSDLLVPNHAVRSMIAGLSL